MGSDFDTELNPYYCTHCRCRINRRESDANNGLCEACVAHARHQRQQAEQDEQERRDRLLAMPSAAFAPEAAGLPPGEDAPFDAWLITTGCQKVRLFWFICLFVPFLSWFAGVVYFALGWLSIPHCQTEAGRLAAGRIVRSGGYMCQFAIWAGIGIAISIGIAMF